MADKEIKEKIANFVNDKFGFIEDHFAIEGQDELLDFIKIDVRSNSVCFKLDHEITQLKDLVFKSIIETNNEFYSGDTRQAFLMHNFDLGVWEKTVKIVNNTCSCFSAEIEENGRMKYIPLKTILLVEEEL